MIQSQGQSRIEQADENGNVRGVVYYVDPQYGYPKSISYEGNLASGIRKSSFADPSQPFYPNRLVSPFLNSNDINQNEDDDSMNVMNAFFNGKVRPNTNNPLGVSGLQSQQYLQQLQRMTANPAAPFLQSAQLNSLVPGQNFPVNSLTNVGQIWPTRQQGINPFDTISFPPQTNPFQRLQIPGNGLNPFLNGQRGLPFRPNLGNDPSQVLQTLGRIQQQDPQSVSFGGNIQSRTAGDGSRGVINGRISWLGNNDQPQNAFLEQEDQDNFIPTANNGLVPPTFSNLVPNSLINQAGNQFQGGNLAFSNPSNVVNGFPLTSPLPRPPNQAVPSNLGQLSNVANLPSSIQGGNQGRAPSNSRQTVESSSSQQESDSGAPKSDLDYEVLVEIADKIAKLARSKTAEEPSTSVEP